MRAMLLQAILTAVVCFVLGPLGWIALRSALRLIRGVCRIIRPPEPVSGLATGATFDYAAAQRRYRAEAVEEAKDRAYVRLQRHVKTCLNEWEPCCAEGDKLHARMVNPHEDDIE